MALLGMVAVDLLSGFADLLDNEELRFLLDYPLDGGLFVAREHDEVVAQTDHFCIAGWRDLDRLDAVGASAFTVERECARDGVLLCALLDALIDTAEDFFVSCRSLSEVHACHSRSMTGGAAR
jgi:hypothetical protein